MEARLKAFYELEGIEKGPEEIAALVEHAQMFGMSDTQVLQKLQAKYAAA